VLDESAPAADRTPFRGLTVRTGGLAAMFVFFSSRLGIAGSIAVSVIVTLILLVVFRVIR
jgi:hypothetical protein